MSIEFKSETIEGVTVLFVKWQDDEQNPSVKIMAHVDGIFAESDISFDDEEKRDLCYEEKTELAALDFVRLARSASGG